MQTRIGEEQLELVSFYIADIQHNLRIPSLAVTIIQNNDVVYQHNSGKAALGRPVTPTTPFIIDSLSKSFTALAIMQLVEAGKLNLDEQVQHYIPWFHFHDLPSIPFQLRNSATSSLITIRHLLNHTSGVSRFAGRTLLSGRGGKTIEQSVRELSKVKLLRHPSSHFEYSNTNYLIVGLLIEIISGMSYEKYIQEHIFHPLQMTTSFTSEQEARDHGMAQGCRWWFGKPVPFDAPYLLDALPAAYIISSAADMGRYLLACLDAGASRDSLLSPQGFAEMYKPQATVPGKHSSYGLGWRIERLGDEPILRHGGEVSNYRADMVLVPRHKLGVVVLANCNNGMVAQLGLDQIALPIVRLLLGQPLSRKMLTFRGFYALVDILVVVLSLLQVGSLVQLLRSLRHPRLSTRVEIGSLLALFGEMIGSVILLWRIPRWADMPWRGLRLYVPDVARWIVMMSAMSGVKSGIHLYRWLKR